MAPPWLPSPGLAYLPFSPELLGGREGGGQLDMQAEGCSLQARSHLKGFHTWSGPSGRTSRTASSCSHSRHHHSTCHRAGRSSLQTGADVSSRGRRPDSPPSPPRCSGKTRLAKRLRWRWCPLPPQHQEPPLPAGGPARASGIHPVGSSRYLSQTAWHNRDRGRSHETTGHPSLCLA